MFNSKFGKNDVTEKRQCPVIVKGRGTEFYIFTPLIAGWEQSYRASRLIRSYHTSCV